MFFSVKAADEKKNKESSKKIVTIHLDWNKLVGKTVGVTGRAANRKLGATIDGPNGVVYIDDFDSWPDKVYSRGNTTTTVKAIGTLVKRDDLPVAVWTPKDGTHPPAAIIVSSQAEKEKAKWRYLLVNVKWEIVPRKLVK